MLSVRFLLNSRLLVSRWDLGGQKLYTWIFSCGRISAPTPVWCKGQLYKKFINKQRGPGPSACLESTQCKARYSFPTDFWPQLLGRTCPDRGLTCLQAHECTSWLCYGLNILYFPQPLPLQHRTIKLNIISGPWGPQISLV